MYKIGQLVKKFGLSRSTLLYYDKIGLLKTTTRSESNYRLYSQEDVDRLTKIVTYKEAGLSLEAIVEILDLSSNESAQILETRLESLNAEIRHLRQQQQRIVQLLGKETLLRSAKVMNKTQWVTILKASGMDEQAMRQWHIEFEKDLPEVHNDFLESLGICAEEIAQIKAWSKGNESA